MKDKVGWTPNKLDSTIMVVIRMILLPKGILGTQHDILCISNDFQNSFIT